MKLLTKGSPYLVDYSEKPKKAIELAMKNKFFKDYKKKIDNFLKSKKKIPIWLIESACKINEKNKMIPVHYQYLWFCLNNCVAYRKTGQRIIKVKVKFFPVYIESNNKIINILSKALNTVGTKTKLGELCNVKRQTIYQCLTKKIKPKFTIFLKSCQLLDKNPWNILNGCKLYGYCCPEEENITFYNYSERKLFDILIWYKLEGHLGITQPLVDTNQKADGLSTLERIKNRIIDLYKINPKCIWIYDNSINKGSQKDWNGYKLTIASAPLRQILCLRYNIPLGYKCSFIKINEEIESIKTVEDFIKIFAISIETEGSFTFQKRNKITKPYLAFTTTSEDLRNQLFNIAKKLNYKPYLVKGYNKGKKTSHKTSYDFRIANLNGIIKCLYDILPYMVHKRKIKNVIKILNNKEFLHIIKTHNPKGFKKIIIEARNKCTNNHNSCNKDLARYLQITNPTKFVYKRTNINSWLSNDKTIPLFAILEMSKIINMNYFELIPEHLSLPLYLHNFIDKTELENIRKQKFNIL